MVPILSQVTKDRVIMTIDLENEDEELHVATDVLEGSVREYSFEVRSRRTNATD